MPPRGNRAAVFVVRHGRLLVIHRRKHGEDYVAIPGGTVERGEDAEAAACRELREETGLRTRVRGPVLVLENQGRRELYFDAVGASGEPVLGGPEARRNSPENRYVLGWVDLADIGRLPVRPDALRAWLAGRDWDPVRTDDAG